MKPQPIADPYAPPQQRETISPEPTDNYAMFFADASGYVVGGRQATIKERKGTARAYVRRSKAFRDAMVADALQPDEIRELIAGKATVDELRARRISA